MREPLVRLESLSISYRERRRSIPVLQEINLTVERGEWVMITGESGAGKSTLLYAIAGLIPPTEGRILIEGRAFTAERERAEYRNKHVGVMFQGSPLLPSFLVWENVALPARIASPSRSRFTPEEKERAIQLLEELGIGSLAERYPHQLSLGQRRRVAIARALMNRPSILLADEPTNDLDPDRVEQLLQLFERILRQGITMIMVTHDERSLKYGGKIYRLAEGKLSEVNRIGSLS